MFNRTFKRMIKNLHLTAPRGGNIKTHQYNNLSTYSATPDCYHRQRDTSKSKIFQEINRYINILKPHINNDKKIRDLFDELHYNLKKSSPDVYITLFDDDQTAFSNYFIGLLKTNNIRFDLVRSSYEQYDLVLDFTYCFATDTRKK